jgi:hypothetical protein
LIDAGGAGTEARAGPVFSVLPAYHWGRREGK